MANPRTTTEISHAATLQSMPGAASAGARPTRRPRGPRRLWRSHRFGRPGRDRGTHEIVAESLPDDVGIECGPQRIEVITPEGVEPADHELDVGESPFAVADPELRTGQEGLAHRRRALPASRAHLSPLRSDIRAGSGEDGIWRLSSVNQARADRTPLDGARRAAHLLPIRATGSVEKPRARFAENSHDSPARPPPAPAAADQAAGGHVGCDDTPKWSDCASSWCRASPNWSGSRSRILRSGRRSHPLTRLGLATNRDLNV
jgi:hypothetical protein